MKMGNANAGFAGSGNVIAALHRKLFGIEIQIHPVLLMLQPVAPHVLFQIFAETFQVPVHGNIAILKFQVNGTPVTVSRDPNAHHVPVLYGKDFVAGAVPGFDVDCRMVVARAEFAKTAAHQFAGIGGPVIAGRLRPQL